MGMLLMKCCIFYETIPVHVWDAVCSNVPFDIWQCACVCMFSISVTAVRPSGCRRYVRFCVYQNDVMEIGWCGCGNISDAAYVCVDSIPDGVASFPKSINIGGTQSSHSLAV